MDYFKIAAIFAVLFFSCNAFAAFTDGNVYSLGLLNTSNKWLIDLNTIDVLKSDKNFICDFLTCYKISDLNRYNGNTFSDANFITQTDSNSLSNETYLSALGKGILTSTAGTGALSVDMGDYGYTPPTLDNSLIFKEEFMGRDLTSGQIGQLGWNSASSGGGASVSFDVADVNRMGILSMNPGTGNNKYATINLGTTSMFFTGNETMEFNAKLFSDLTQSNKFILRIGCGDNTTNGDFTDGVYIEEDNSAVTTIPTWNIVTAKGGVRTRIDTGVHLDNNWNDFKIESNSDASVITFYIRNTFTGIDTNIGVITTNIPNVIANSCGPIIQVIKSSGGNAQYWDFDYFQLKKYVAGGV